MSPGYEGIFYNPLRIKVCSASTSSRQCRVVYVWLAGFVPLYSLITNSQFYQWGWLQCLAPYDAGQGGGGGDHKRKIIGRSGRSAVILKGLKSAITFSTLSCPLLHLCSPVHCDSEHVRWSACLQRVCTWLDKTSFLLQTARLALCGRISCTTFRGILVQDIGEPRASGELGAAGGHCCQQEWPAITELD